MNAPHLEPLSAGVDLIRSLEAVAARLGAQRGQVQAAGPLQRVVVRPTVDAPALAIEGPVELVQAEGLLVDGPLVLRGVVAWSDRGVPRMAAGYLDDAVSAGLLARVHIWQAGPSAQVGATAPMEAPAPRPSAEPARPRRPRKAADPAVQPTRREPEPAADDDDDPHVNLAPELDALAAQPTPTPPAPPAGGGWAAAVAASRNAPRRPMPSPDDLGFDVDGAPELKRGDLLIHPRFGRCRVLRAAQGDKVRIQRPTGAHIDLHLRVVQFRRLPDEDGKRIFQLKIGR
ncbi:MAG: hypothetical protein H6702_02945 [Myxococcales bacterium]|nr:hypothetical protein [Myxococcales bacterium]